MLRPTRGARLGRSARKQRFTRKQAMKLPSSERAREPSVHALPRTPSMNRDWSAEQWATIIAIEAVFGALAVHWSIAPLGLCVAALVARSIRSGFIKEYRRGRQDRRA